MSLSCSDCFSDLLCGEDSSIIFSGGGLDFPEYSSDLESLPTDVEESIAGLLQDERDLAESNSRPSHQPVDASARAESVAWILKVQQYYGFQPLTAYLSVTYFDRFIFSHHLPKMNGWPLQLLSVACLSLAAKMEEPLAPSLLDLQVEGAKFIFEPRNILRMELLVLRVLDWRLRTISPFCYLCFFAVKVDPTGTCTGFLTSRATGIILSVLQETSLLEYRPSCIAAAAILCAANDLPSFSLITAQHAESWSDGLHRDNITNCYQLLQQMGLKNKPKKQPKVLPQLRVTTLASITTSSESSSSSSSSSSYKRRKLNNSSWANDDKEKF
ncbi:cyclin-D1-1-like isoform X2 [Andrographis paniculata]|uniref:cyclin-D1-1-like isoform X2 n=1 Tax=Andrographis paniculata TaxID=175694 RepID=UPI0021E981AE|nr:cyclin-D1-1-like isoform X2 [Andrographis paniculata]